MKKSYFSILALIAGMFMISCEVSEIQPVESQKKLDLNGKVINANPPRTPPICGKNPAC